MAQKKKIEKKVTEKKSPAGRPVRSPAATVISQKGTKTNVLSSKVVFKGKVFSVFRDEVIEPTGMRNVREVIRHNGSVVILAVDESKNPADPDVILERQYRHAAGQFLLELPAGRVEPGESTLAAAKREMIEETGYRAKRWTLLTKYFASPGFLGEWMQIYLAREIRNGKAQPEDDEKIDVVRMPLSEALALVSANKIHDGKTLIGLMLYDRARRQGLL
ncbi:NUDIX hydrolase [Edaphobacter aggregans]|uniref:NUDIX hydrolase n=1 Tax=Edaphobacter aggregans TaxID=570835 RepID=UPI000690F51D|nr:NUDIX hydrolase [Edaphobacter aggregans]